MSVKLYFKSDGSSNHYKYTVPSGVAVQALVIGRDGQRQVVDGREAPWTLQFGSNLICRVELGPIKYREDNNHADLYSRLWALSEALAAGEYFHLALDHTKAGLWPLRDSGDVDYGFPAEEDDRVWLGTERLNLEVGSALSVGDMAVIEEETPGSRLWMSRVASWSGSAPITVDLELDNHRPFTGRSWMRHHDFLPYLYRVDSHRSADPFAFLDPGQRIAQWTMELTQRLPEV